MKLFITLVQLVLFVAVFGAFGAGQPGAGVVIGLLGLGLWYYKKQKFASK